MKNKLNQSLKHWQFKSVIVVVTIEYQTLVLHSTKRSTFFIDLVMNSVL